MRTSDFDYLLDEALIARSPAVPRDSSRMMVVSKDNVEHRIFRDVLDYLRPGDSIVINSSKVIKSRILVEGKEIFLLKRLGKSEWNCMVYPGNFFRVGCSFKMGRVCGEVVKVLEDGTRNIVFENEDVLFELGQIPFPPYIKGVGASPDDYQTVYAKSEGSVAAPTAGLHFTEDLLDRIRGAGVNVIDVVLHVGRGTFLPVYADDLKDHFMHSEDYYLSADSAEKLNGTRVNGGKIVAVGTTSVRVLESSFVDGRFSESSGSTNLFIYPQNYRWKAVDALITNFHLPKSTLLMLVASFLENKGFVDPVDELLALYRDAMKEGYRFYSFGDAMLIF
ncbi:tRNA preQ1(34) S-adenosylmethionine ribosyltransferase-isomerase QueA [Candidatus Peregrinibacteria bacterium HGW-Peregrinibacteria-1]|jgi:S-adenosylmethionine:tRNA ribosyltransferase-isomerase|nr:MAG: tRNA preQ1(34) S-adenosylmethionine ribosyltransferase-isomerase QueA [Candidatus Peregrinibacteria bacterium HGW-Peregrinibacteria-1]